jgi:hypothetical protein
VRVRADRISRARMSAIRAPETSCRARASLFRLPAIFAVQICSPEISACSGQFEHRAVMASPTGITTALRPGAGRAISRPSRRSSSVTKPGVRSGRPMPSASLNEVNFLHIPLTTNPEKSASGRAQDAQTPGCHPHRQGVLGHSTTPIPRRETQGELGDGTGS